jgi:hypothetical protein
VARLKYLGATVSNKNYIQEEIRNRLKSGNACYYSVQTLLPSCLLSKNISIKIRGPFAKSWTHLITPSRNFVQVR